MRPARADRPWSRRRVRRRARYAAYLASPAWAAKRRAWYADWLTRQGTEPACQVCDLPWTLIDGDLHHASYARLGSEQTTDLVPVCRAHHEQLHDILDRHRAWRRLGRRAATAGIIRALRDRGTDPA